MCCSSDGRSHVKCPERDRCWKMADEQRAHDPRLLLVVTVDTDSSSPTSGHSEPQFLKKRNFPSGDL